MTQLMILAIGIFHLLTRPTFSRELILEKALAHVQSVGWTTEALALGAQDAGLLATSHGIVRDVSVAFPRA